MSKDADKELEPVSPEVAHTKPFNQMDYVNRSCKHCYGAGIYGRMLKEGSDPMSIMCSCIQKNMQKAMQQAMQGANAQCQAGQMAQAAQAMAKAMQQMQAGQPGQPGPTWCRTPSRSWW